MYVCVCVCIYNYTCPRTICMYACLRTGHQLSVLHPHAGDKSYAPRWRCALCALCVRVWHTISARTFCHSGAFITMPFRNSWYASNFVYSLTIVACQFNLFPLATHSLNLFAFFSTAFSTHTHSHTYIVACGTVKLWDCGAVARQHTIFISISRTHSNNSKLR